MLYGVDKPKIDILTHSYSPLMDKNGFRQVVDLSPSSDDVFTLNDEIPRSSESYGAEDLFRGRVKRMDESRLSLTPTKSSRDPYYEDHVSGLGSRFSKAVKKVSHAVSKPIKRIVAINIGGITGAAAGFVTSGFNPVGAIAGGAAGSAKAFHDVTRTGDVHITTKSAYQSAGWGAGAGAVVGAVSSTQAALANAQKAKSAAMASKVGYGAARETAMAAGTYSPSAAPVGILAKFAGGAKAVMASPVTQLTAAQILLGGKGGSAPEGAPGGETSTPIVVVPGGGGPTYQPGFGPISEGGYPGEGGMGPTGASPTPGEGLPEEAPQSAFKKNLPLLAGAGILGFFMLRKVKIG